MGAKMSDKLAAVTRPDEPAAESVAESHLPKISIVVPSFNQAGYLELALRSIIEQGYPNLELIVIDGGSKDESPEIIRKYESYMKFWCSEPDGGQVPGIIKGFSHATGEILFFLNSDDLLEPGALHEVGEYFARNPNTDVVFGNTLWIDANGNPIRPQKEIPFNRFIFLYTYNYIPGMSTFWRRAIYDRVGGFDASFQMAFDADLWMRFSEHGTIKHVARQWSRMRFYPEQKTQRFLQTALDEDMLIRSRYWRNHAMPSTYYLRRKIALSIRITWKLLTGCYEWGYRRRIKNA
jgi:glycosyltransferase involved in cell wall biosynthesis